MMNFNFEHLGYFCFHQVSDIQDRQFRVRLSIFISEISWGALFGQGVVNRANTVSSLKIVILCFTGKIIEDSDGEGF